MPAGRPNKTQRVIRQLKASHPNPQNNQQQSQTSYGGMYIPNHSGDHSAGFVNKTPTQDKDLVNKEYVDNNSGVWTQTGTIIYYDQGYAYLSNEDYSNSPDTLLHLKDSSLDTAITLEGSKKWQLKSGLGDNFEIYDPDSSTTIFSATADGTCTVTNALVTDKIVGSSANFDIFSQYGNRGRLSLFGTTSATASQIALLTNGSTRLIAQTNGLIYFLTDAGGLPYGNIYTNSTIAVTISSSSTATQVSTGGGTDFTAGELLNASHSDPGITIGRSGRYIINWSMDLAQNSPSAAITAVGGVMVNTTAHQSGRSEAYLPNNTTVRNLSSCTIIDCAASDVIYLFVQNNTNTTNLDVQRANITISQIGGT